MVTDFFSLLVQSCNTSRTGDRSGGQCSRGSKLNFVMIPHIVMRPGGGGLHRYTFVRLPMSTGTAKTAFWGCHVHCLCYYAYAMNEYHVADLSSWAMARRLCCLPPSCRWEVIETACVLVQSKTHHLIHN